MTKKKKLTYSYIMGKFKNTNIEKIPKAYRQIRSSQSKEDEPQTSL